MGYRLNGQVDDRIAATLGLARAVLADRGRAEEAGRILGEVIALQVMRLGERHPQTLSTYLDLIRVLRITGKLEEADTVLSAQLWQSVHLLESGERLELVHVTSSLADAFYGRGKMEKAADLYSKALECRTELLGGRAKTDPECLKLTSNLAVALKQAGTGTAHARGRAEHSAQTESRTVGSTTATSCRRCCEHCQFLRITHCPLPLPPRLSPPLNRSLCSVPSPCRPQANPMRPQRSTQQCAARGTKPDYGSSTPTRCPWPPAWWICSL